MYLISTDSVETSSSKTNDSRFFLTAQSRRDFKNIEIYDMIEKD